MSRRSLSRLSRQALLSGLDEAESRQRSGDADVLAYLGEVGYRRLFAQFGYSSLYNWCIHARHYSEDVAVKRIRVARAARRFPVILDMLADGRLHLTAIALLSHRLTPANAKELLAAAVHRSKRQIEHMLAERFPQADVPTVVQPMPAARSLPAPGPVNSWPADSAPGASAAGPSDARPSLAECATPASASAAATVDRASVQTSPPSPPAYSRVTPLSPGRSAVQFTMDEGMEADLIRAQELLGPQEDSDRVRAVFRRALRDLVNSLEKRKLAATDRPRAQRADGTKTRAQVKREVRERDQDRCAWITEDGKRCEERKNLQFDHIKPKGKGGGWTTPNVRLLCTAHNRLAAEQVYGEGFMHQTVERHREARERTRRPQATAVPAGTDAAASAPPDPTEPSRRDTAIPGVPVAPALPDPLSCAPAQAASSAPPCP